MDWLRSDVRCSAPVPLGSAAIKPINPVMEAKVLQGYLMRASPPNKRYSTC
jgi:hypothetical protein